MLSRLALIVLIAFGCLTAARAQVVLNEFCFSNYTDWNLGGEYEDWVEFYNPTATAFNISGYYLSDNINNPMKWQIPAGTTVPAFGYRLILVSGTGLYNPNYLGQLNTSFKVTQTAGEEVVFSNTIGTVLESYDFDVITPLQANHSWGRSTDGAPTWVIFTNPSQGAANSGPIGAAYAAAPVFSQQAGYYSAPITVSISTPEPSATIRYTTNGSIPTAASTLYTGPISLSGTTVLRAVTFSSNGFILRSTVSTNTYFFGADVHTLPTVSVCGNAIGDGYWPWGADEVCNIEFFAAGGVFQTEAFGDSNEHGNDSNAYGQRGFDYITRDALGYDHEVHLPIFHHTDRQSYERLIFKAAANDNYPFSGGAHLRDSYVSELSILGDLKLDERKTESCIVYLNGQYWGVYDVREKVDDIDYTDYYYDQPEGFVDYLKTWGGTWTEYGSGADWTALVNFITTNDMSIQANYDYVVTQYNTHSLIDYFVLNGYVICTDWLNWNTSWWRGRHPLGDARRWRYALWDNDATFGHYINYTGVPSTAPTADPCQVEGIGNPGGQGHVPVLNALFNNDQFFADYIQRYAAHSNTIFSCERMIEVLDSMANVIDPEMTRQCNRWGGTKADWLVSVQEIRDFILARCNDEIIGGIEDCYDVTAFDVTVQVQGMGDIELMDIELDETNSPWSGTFFGGLSTEINADVDANGLNDDCMEFINWQIVAGTGTITNPTSPETTFSFDTNVTLQANFQVPADPIELFTDVFPAGGGTIELNGSLQPAYPGTESLVSGTDVGLVAIPALGYEFVGWQSVNGTLLGDTASISNTFSSCYGDSIFAVFQSMSVVPVEWLGFEAVLQTDVVNCHWTTLTEINNDYFTVERSADMVTWSGLAQLDGAGNSLNPRSYTWKDTSPLNGVSYYRIRQTDFNGQEDLSVVRAVNRTGQLSLSVFPNPGRGQFRLEGLSDFSTLRIHDVSGREVPFRSLGGNWIEMPGAMPGVYMAEVSGQSVRIVVVP
jgi:hypothetical protein